MGDERTREGGESANAAPSAAPAPDEEVQPESPAENGSDERQEVPTDQTPSFWRSGLEGAWPVFLGLLPALATLLSLIFVIRPSWRPVEPPQARGVEIKDVVLAERQRTLADGEEVTVVYYDVEAVGYDADKIVVATEWI